MCDLEADIAAICARHGFDPDNLIAGNARLSRVLDDGLAELSGGVLRMRGEHRFLVRAAAAAFDAYLDQSPRQHGKAA
jgi:oxygen-independent coproporphyrinogen-3 oxidase